MRNIIIKVFVVYAIIAVHAIIVAVVAAAWLEAALTVAAKAACLHVQVKLGLRAESKTSRTIPHSHRINPTMKLHYRRYQA